MTTTNNSGIFRNALNRLIAAREAQAARYVSGVLMRFDDETLRAHGYSREQLKRTAGLL